MASKKLSLFLYEPEGHHKDSGISKVPRRKIVWSGEKEGETVNIISQSRAFKRVSHSTGHERELQSRLKKETETGIRYANQLIAGKVSMPGFLSNK